MNTFTRVKLIIAGLATVGAAVSPAAHADPDTKYIVDLATAGLPMGSAAQEIYMGQLICKNLAGGLSTTDAALRLINGGGVSTDVAVAIVGLAVIDMCPQFASVPITHTPPPAVESPVPVTIASAIA